MLVDDDGQMPAGALHLPEHVDDAAGFGDDQHGVGDAPYLGVGPGAHESFEPGDAEGVVEAGDGHGEAAMAGGERPVEGVGGRRRGLHPHDVGPGHHDVGGDGVPELEDPFDEQAVGGFQLSGRCCLRHQMA